jgi:hypothetical protein
MIVQWRPTHEPNTANVWIPAFALGLLLATNWPATATPCGPADVAFLVGSWASQDEKTVIEERWVATPSGQLIGSSFSVHLGATGGFAEAETIVDNGGKLTLRLRHFDPGLQHAREEKDTPMEFVAASCSANGIVFDGLGDRASEHIAYRRAGDTLTFIGDFLHQGKPFHAEQSLAPRLP